MESNRDEAYRCIELTKYYIKKKELDAAWRFSVKANQLFPTSETKNLMKKLKLKVSKRQSMKRKQSVSDYSDDNNSSTSSNNDCCRQQSKKKSKVDNPSSTAYSYSAFKEINKDESYKCIEKAEKYLQKNQLGMVEKLLLKSIKLFPLPRADELLKQLQENKPKYTEEQENVVKKVKNSENFYEMLNIKTNATISEIKKAYKKLALLLHPDKNSAPGAGEVFVVVSNAVDTLCDDSKRKSYDQSLRKPTTTSFNQYSRYSYRQEPASFHKKRSPKKKNYTCFVNSRFNVYDSPDYEDYEFPSYYEEPYDSDWHEYTYDTYDY